MLDALKSAEERRLEKALSEFEDRLSRDTAPHEESGQEAIRRRYKEAQRSTEAFGRTYAPHYFFAESAAFHKDLDKMVRGSRRHVYLVHGPREHAKSTRARIGLLRRILLGELHYPLLVSEDLYIARGHLDYLAAEMTLNRRILSDFDVEVTKYNRQEGILRVRITSKATRRSHYVQIDAVSYGTQVKGRIFRQWRPDFALVDDFEDTREARNEKLSRLKVAWILQELYPAVVDTAPIVWLGNTGSDTSALFQAMLRTFGEEDALRAFLRAGTKPGGSLPAEPQIVRPERKEAAPGGEIEPGSPDDMADAEISAYCYRARTVKADGRIVYLWPERYSPGWYESMRATMGPSTFESEMNGNPIREGAFFKAEWFQTYEEVPEDARWFSWCDPAFGQSADSCYKVIVVCAATKTDYFVVDAYCRQGEPTSAMIESWYALFSRHDELRHGQYENNFGQDDRLARDFQDAAQRHGWPLPVSGDGNSANKDARIESMEALAATMRIRWPEKPNDDVKRLKHQMLTWPYGADDGPDALESCISRMRGGAIGGMHYQGLGRRRITSSRRRR